MEDSTTIKLLHTLGSSSDMLNVSAPTSTNSGEDAGFEGPEKILEIDFNPNVGGTMRSLDRESWDSILDLARCQILSKTSNDDFDAYVLSESSLFVYDNKVFIKTCGTTTLLRCLPLLLEKAKSINKEMEWLCYSRKNYIFPDVQVFPHNSFAHEIEYTKKCYGPHGEPLRGGAYILGDIQGDHWYVFCADYSGDSPSASDNERNLNIMMYGLDPDVCQEFYRQTDLELKEDAARVTDNTGIRSLCGKGTIIDDWMFEPCGYSMNGLNGSTFYTIHVTPEEAFSYASFETNLECTSYDNLIQEVLQVFRPQRFIITLFADEAALGKIQQCPTQIQSLSLDRLHSTQFRRETQSTTCFRDEYACRMAVYTMADDGNKSVLSSECSRDCDSPFEPISKHGREKSPMPSDASLQGCSETDSDA